MTVSVIIPCYNQGQYLSRAISSLQVQTLQDWEAIIVDDGSTDNSWQIANELAKTDARIKIYHKENGGSGSARNMGLDNASGEFIQFLDADDMLHPEKLEVQVRQMRESNAELSYTDFCTFVSTDKIGKPKSVNLSYKKVLLCWGLGYSVPLHAFLFRAKLALNHRFLDELRVREDWYWALMTIKRANKIIHVSFNGAYYYHNDSGKTGSYIRMQEGNFAFMASMAKQLNGIHKFLWTFRISEELWIWLLRMIKYRSATISKSVFVLDKFSLVAAILLMPLSIWWIVIYFIKTYIAK